MSEYLGEASSLVLIIMTEFQVEHFLHRRTLTLEHDRKFTPTNINL